MAGKRERGIRPLPDGRWLWCYTDPAGKFHRNRALRKASPETLRLYHTVKARYRGGIL